MLYEVITTILSGDIGNSGDTDNSYHVVTSSGLDNTAVLDGLTITGGKADGGGWNDENGAGMYNEYSNPTIINCTFSDNSAESRNNFV